MTLDELIGALQTVQERLQYPTANVEVRDEQGTLTTNFDVVTEYVFNGKTTIQFHPKKEPQQ